MPGWVVIGLGHHGAMSGPYDDAERQIKVAAVVQGMDLDSAEAALRKIFPEADAFLSVLCVDDIETYCLEMPVDIREVTARLEPLAEMEDENG